MQCTVSSRIGLTVRVMQWLSNLSCVWVQFSVGHPVCCNIIILLHRTIVCKVEIISCRLEKLICEVWALSRWQQCCVNLAATFALWWLDLLSLHLQIIRYVDKYVLLNLQVTYKELKQVERVVWMWELNLWSCWIWKLQSAGMWWHIVWWIGTA